MITMTALSLLLLYVSFRAKQFGCDFLLQTDWMALTKGKPGKEGYRALFSHTITHGVATTVIMLIFAPALWWMGIVDLLVHSTVDRTKGLLTNQCGWKPTDTAFWWAFGFDQEAHNFTHLAYIVIVVMHHGGLVL
ncbi:MAG: DUF3307 domain-containing protein [Alphaproteobacteria bacterium]|nr:DUF3307 domain-containing protein [Alphaproteobacteria bacterium]